MIKILFIDAQYFFLLIVWSRCSVFMKQKLSLRPKNRGVKIVMVLFVKMSITPEIEL